MKKFFKSVLTAALVCSSLSMAAANVDQVNGTTENFSWEYWNDVNDNTGIYAPNWKISFNTPYEEGNNPTVSINYVLKQGDTQVAAGAANTTYVGLDVATAYVFLPENMAAGEYSMLSTVTIIEAGETDPQITELTPVNFTVAAGPTDKPKAVLTYNVENGPAVSKFNYQIGLENIEEESVTAYHIGAFAPGDIVKAESDVKEGTLEIDVTQGNITLWVKGYIKYMDGEEEKQLNLNPNDIAVDFKQISDPGAVVPTISIKAAEPTATSISTGTVNYTITTDMPELAGVTYRVWCVTEGDKMLGEIVSTTELTGTLELANLNKGTVTNLWVKAQASVGPDKSNEAQYPGEAEGYTGLSIDTSSFDDGNTPVMPAITLTASNAEPTSKTTGTLDYSIALSSDKFFKSAHLYVVTNAFEGGDVKVAEIDINSVDALTGTLELTGLKESAINNLWVKATVTISDDTTCDEITYPGAAENWQGLFVDTSKFAEEGEPVMPEVSLVAFNPVQTGDTTATLNYTVTLSSEEFFKSLHIYVVTNAFGGEDVVLCDIPATTELSGTLNLEGLMAGAVNELWVKAAVTISDDRTSSEVTYPGAAEGWNGLSVDMTNTGVDGIAIDMDAEAEYYNMQGVRVLNPEQGLYIVRRGGKVSKVIVK